MASEKRIYVISDLHLGGAYGNPDTPTDRGFRLCTHVAALAEFIGSLDAQSAGAASVELVINGDMVDFLAERPSENMPWAPFIHDEDMAASKLESILTRDPALVSALRGFLDKGHRLVLLLGNHDIELSLPAVRRRLRKVLGIRGSDDFVFLYDGEGYLAGDALIEHGNRYDKFNVIDNDGLRRVRSLLSRRQAIPAQYAFVPPPGSRMVSEVINPIKEQYRFVDMLKPENEAVIPLILALEPGFRSRLTTAIALQIESGKHGLAEPALPKLGSDISSGASAGAAGPMGGDMGTSSRPKPAAAPPPTRAAADPLREALRKTLGNDAEAFERDIAGPGSDISTADTIDRALGIFSLLMGGKKDQLDKRLPALLKALRATQGNQAFSRDVETDAPTWESAQRLAMNGIKHVVFGHTHLPKRIALKSGGYYLNAGTWADVFEFPKDVIVGPEEQAIPRLRAFVERIASGDFSEWTLFRPTYVQLTQNANGVTLDAQLCDYAPAKGG